MKADVNQAVNAFKQDVGLGRGMLARLKNTSVALIFLAFIPLMPMLKVFSASIRA